MSEQATASGAGAPTHEPQPRQPTKSATVLKLLIRKSGATLAELATTTSWQPHTVRAHLTRLRQSGHTLERVARKSGPDAYRIAASSPVANAAPAAEPQA